MKKNLRYLSPIGMYFKNTKTKMLRSNLFKQLAPPKENQHMFYNIWSMLFRHSFEHNIIQHHQKQQQIQLDKSNQFYCALHNELKVEKKCNLKCVLGS